MTKRDGALEIGQHVTRLMEKLEADPTMTDEFLAGDGALLITRLGVTFTGFEDRPDPDFQPSPMNADAAAGMHFAEVRQATESLLLAIEADPGKRRDWLADPDEAIRVG
jgi:hypothetical protein